MREQPKPNPTSLFQKSILVLVYLFAKHFQGDRDHIYKRQYL
jgi:hypothetical protein